MLLNLIRLIAGKVCVPKQLVISKDPSSIPDAVAKSGLALPLGKGTVLWCSDLSSLLYIVYGLCPLMLPKHCLEL